MNDTLTSIYKIYLVMSAPPHFPDVTVSYSSLVCRGHMPRSYMLWSHVAVSWSNVCRGLIPRSDMPRSGMSRSHTAVWYAAVWYVAVWYAAVVCRGLICCGLICRGLMAQFTMQPKYSRSEDAAVYYVAVSHPTVANHPI